MGEVVNYSHCPFDGSGVAQGFWSGQAHMNASEMTAKKPRCPRLKMSKHRVQKHHGILSSLALDHFTWRCSWRNL